MAKGGMKGKYLVLHDELAPGEDFEASVKPMFASVDEHLLQDAMPETLVPSNPDGPNGVNQSPNREGHKYPDRFGHK